MRKIVHRLTCDTDWWIQARSRSALRPKKPSVRKLIRYMMGGDQAAVVIVGHFNRAQGWGRESQAKRSRYAPACLSPRGSCRLCRYSETPQVPRRPPSRADAIAAGKRATAVGTFALGALAIGALAIGALAIGRLEIRKARLREVKIDSLIVRRFNVADGADESENSAEL